MSKQRYVRDSFWTDPYIETLDPSEKLLFLYYLTNPLCNIAGIYEVRNNRVAYETGFDKEMVEKIKQRFVKDGKMLIVDDWIILKNFAKNQSTNPNVVTGMQRIVEDLPDKVKALKGFESLSHFTLLNLTLPNLTKQEKSKATASREKETKFTTEGADVIKLFESIDPKNKRYYANKTQRKACDFLIEEYGMEQVQNAIEFYKKARSNNVEYLPTITTPHQLVEKWQQLLSLVSRKKAENEKLNNLMMF